MRPLTTQMQILAQHPHVLSQELLRVLLELHATLKPGGCCLVQTRAVAMKR